jgi:xanthine dehydrogenase YagS FAD-binding subunit
MKPFEYQAATAPADAIRAGDGRNTKFLAGGTNLVDLMKYGVESPSRLVDINRLDLAQLTADSTGSVTIGALVRNSDVADHSIIKSRYPLLSQALLSGASPQLRNMASTGGNLLQRTRCYYFMDMSFPACNKRAPGSGCAAIEGYNRIHAVLGQTDHGARSGDSCIATHPSDMCVAMAALDASVEVEGPKGKRSIPFAEFHKLPGLSPWIETSLRPDELIVAVKLPAPKFSGNSHYLKVRDRNSYAFALISVAAGLQLEGGRVRSAGLALGGVAHKPWRAQAAEHVLLGKPATDESFRQAADILLHGAKGYEHNGFKIELAKRNVVRALTLAAQAKPEQEQV